MVPGGTVLNIEKGQWHSLKCLESGTVLLVAMDSAKRTAGEVMPCNGNDLLEAKDGTFEPLGEDEITNGTVK